MVYDLNIEVVGEGDQRTYGDLLKMPEGTDKNTAEFDWKAAGLLTDRLDEVANAATAFREAHLSAYKAGESDLQPPFEIIVSYNFLGDLTDSDRNASLHEVKVRVVPTDSKVTLGQLKKFTKKVTEEPEFKTGRF